MNPIFSLDDLKHHYLYHNQHWYYVLLVNALDPTQAGKKVLECVDYFDMDSGKSCDFFIPGFVNGDRGVLTEKEFESIKRYIGHSIVFDSHNLINIYIERIGTIPFYPKLFLNFYKALEEEVRYKSKWKYSGRCELLMFSVNEFGKVNPDDFYNYDLDDIVLNNRTVSEFIRKLITLAESNVSKEESKRAIDELYFDMIMPRSDHYNEGYFHLCSDQFQLRFGNKKYAFISYSSKDRIFVDSIRNQLKDNNVECWMAPYDIPDGTSYAYVIEKAIEHADTFFLMLSFNSLKSLWVEKEMLRAIGHYFKDKQDKLHVVWLNQPFDLSGTPFATPLENVQSSIVLENSLNNIYRLMRLLNPQKATIMYADKMFENIYRKINEEFKHDRQTKRLDKGIDRFKSIYESGDWLTDGRNTAYSLIKIFVFINDAFALAIKEIGAFLNNDDIKNNQDYLLEHLFYCRCLEILNKKELEIIVANNVQEVRKLLKDNLSEDPVLKEKIFNLVIETRELTNQEMILLNIFI